MKERLRVLYVEDDDGAREELLSLASVMDHDAYAASNGKEGLEEFFRVKPHIVVSDVVMPIMNGLDMSRQIKAYNDGAIIVLTTAFSEKHLLLGAIEAGVDGFLLKPLDVSKLATKIDGAKAFNDLEPTDPKKELLRKQIKSEALDDFIFVCGD